MRKLPTFPPHAHYVDGRCEHYIDNTMPMRPDTCSMYGNGSMLTAESYGAEGDDARELKKGANHDYKGSEALKAAWVRRKASKAERASVEL